MKIIKEKRVFSGFLKLNELEIELSNGAKISREVIIKKDSVAIVPVTENGEIFLTKQPRAGRGVDDSIEIPAGLVDETEEFLQTAKRELLEETGCVADEFIELAVYYSDPACCTSETHLYLALGAKKVQEQNLDEDEFLTVFSVPATEVYKYLDCGKIADANSMIALMKARDIIFKKI
ncbi:MAG: NUDIX hydrolase [Clostridia bacterium]|nr:NUDIX hydrolase [Clostridia bacterium]